MMQKTLKDIKEAEADYRAGRIFTIEQVLRKLGARKTKRS